jgi:hypothetical protein
MMRHPVDGRLHFSELKAHAKSAAHVKLATLGARTITDVMRIGGVADSLVFDCGKSHVLYEGRRDARSLAWQQFQEEHAGKYIVIQPELDRATGAAEAALADPVAQRVLEGCRFQQVMQWEAYGLPCAAGIKGERGGFDALGPDSIADLKVTRSAEPEELSRHILNQHWHAQLAWYRTGARSLGRTVDVCRIIAVESAPPHNVTVMRIPERWLTAGEQLCALWAERHRACEAADSWPGYVQDEVEAIDPSWMADGPELEGLDDDD